MLSPFFSILLLEDRPHFQIIHSRHIKTLLFHKVFSDSPTCLRLVVSKNNFYFLLQQVQSYTHTVPIPSEA